MKKLILRADVDGLGRKGDLVDVSTGYARNYLVPKGLALPSTPGAEAQAEAMRQTRVAKNAAGKAEAEELAAKIVPMVITIAARASEEGTLFGSVTTADVSTALAEQAGVEIPASQLESDEHIKDTGTHHVLARPHPEVMFPITLDVIAVEE